MNSIQSYSVGDHIFSIINSSNSRLEDFLPSYKVFQTDVGLEHSLFSLELISEPLLEEGFTLLTKFRIDDAECEIRESDLEYEIRIYPDINTTCNILRTTKHFDRAYTHLLGETTDHFVLNNYLMMLYTFATATKQTLMFHASAIAYNDSAYLFLGKSGTGKSTHARLWVDHIQNSELLNDDNPIVRIMDDKIYAYGSPWSGKTPCYKNKVMNLGAVVRLKQAPENRLTKVSQVQAFASILPSCSYLRQIPSIRDAVYQSIIQLAEHIPVYELECLPNPESAQLCFQKII